MTHKPDLEALEQLRDSMLEQLEGEKMSGLDLDALRDAMNRPGALETVGELMALEPASVQQGEVAPDFELPYLAGHPGADGKTLRLSAHRGDRPVALIFGSYT